MFASGVIRLSALSMYFCALTNARCSCSSLNGMLLFVGSAIDWAPVRVLGMQLFVSKVGFLANQCEALFSLFGAKFLWLAIRCKASVSYSVVLLWLRPHNLMAMQRQQC